MSVKTPKCQTWLGTPVGVIPVDFTIQMLYDFGPNVALECRTQNIYCTFLVVLQSFCTSRTPIQKAANTILLDSRFEDFLILRPNCLFY